MADEILRGLRALGACGDAVRPAEDPEGPGWVTEWLAEHEPDLAELWRVAVRSHLDDAWWLAARLGVVRTALDASLRRALGYAAEAQEAAGLDGSQLRHVAAAEVLDYVAAEEAAGKAALKAAPRGRAAAAHAVGAAGAAARAVEDAGPAFSALVAARSADAARHLADVRAEGAEEAKQREDLLALWPEVERAFRAVEGRDE